MEEHSQRPHIAVFVVVSAEDLWRHVVSGAYNFVGAHVLHFLAHVVVPLEGKSEVDEGDGVVVFVVEEEVLGLEVAVADLLQVQVLHRLQHLHENLTRFLLRKAALLVQAVEQLAPFAEAA